VFASFVVAVVWTVSSVPASVPAAVSDNAPAPQIALWTLTFPCPTVSDGNDSSAPPGQCHSAVALSPSNAAQP